MSRDEGVVVSGQFVQFDNDGSQGAHGGEEQIVFDANSNSNTDSNNNNNNNNNNDLLRPARADEPTWHPFCFFFNFFFKALSWAAYLILFYIWPNFVVVFIAVVSLIAIDFWVTKNIIGRRMVALRWWNVVKEDGTSYWKFENGSARRAVHPKEKAFFWFFLFLMPISWITLSIPTFLTLRWRWLLISIVGIVLGGANLIGYWQCSRTDAKAFAMKVLPKYPDVVGATVGSIVLNQLKQG